MALIYQPSKRIFCGWFEPLKSTTYSEYPKILSQIPPDVLKKATEKLIENGLLEPEDIPTQEDMEALDRLADRIGIPSLKDVMMN